MLLLWREEFVVQLICQMLDGEEEEERRERGNILLAMVRKPVCAGSPIFSTYWQGQAAGRDRPNIGKRQVVIAVSAYLLR